MSGRILVVEDDLAIRYLVTELLKDEGYEVETAPGGTEGLELLGSWQPNLVLLDWMMPNVSGAIFRYRQQRLPGQQSSIPVVVLTARKDALDEIAECGVAATILKPFDEDELLGTVKAVLGRSGC